MLDCGILSYLPVGLAAEISSVAVARVEEIRLRLNGSCSITCERGTFLLKYRADRRDMDETVKKLCNGSLYAYSDTINQGYIIMNGGIRVGICGRAVTEKGKIIGIYDISSLSVRIPHKAPAVGSAVHRLLAESGYFSGVLVYAPPGAGKTTLLRSVIAMAAGGSGAVRTAVIDTRGELGCFLPKDLCADVLSGYPRGTGIEIAVRTLSPQLIVCDEIGADPVEAEAIASAHNCGVALLATAHARTADELLSKKGISLLHAAHVFSYYVGLKRVGDDYDYTIARADEV